MHRSDEAFGISRIEFVSATKENLMFEQDSADECGAQDQNKA
jgi:hypothetical protein